MWPLALRPVEKVVPSTKTILSVPVSQRGDPEEAVGAPLVQPWSVTQLFIDQKADGYRPNRLHGVPGSLSGPGTFDSAAASSPAFRNELPVRSQSLPR